ncbi:MAG: hypothetical protein V1734_06975 [Nanoarchaeota archaeon]
MSRIIGDRTMNNTLDEMEEVARARNRDVAEEERIEALRKAEEAKRAKENAIKAKAEAIEAEEARKRIGKGIIQKTPTPEVPGEVTRDGPALGLLYSHCAKYFTTLFYRSFQDLKDYPLLSVNGVWIQAIFATNDNVYYGKCETKGGWRGAPEYFEDNVCSLFTGNSFDKKDKVNAIEMVDGRIVDSGHYGLDDTLAGDNYLEKTPLISLAEHDGSLYGMLTNSDHKLFARIKNKNQPYMCEATTIFYPRTTSRLSQMIIIPYNGPVGKIESSPLTVLSCAYGKCLDINGFAIAGTEESTEDIKRIALLGLEGSIADIAYCREGTGLINAIKVDISTLKASGRRSIVTKAGEFDAVHAVRSLKLHEKLLGCSKVEHVDNLILYDNINGEDTL